MHILCPIPPTCPLQVITNGSRVSDEWLSAHAGKLDMLGLSFDSGSNAVNFEHGRWPAGAAAPRPDMRSRATLHLLRASDLAHKHGVEFKVNTVVTSKNCQEDVSGAINAARPLRWKVFQAMALEGENTGSGACTDISPFLLSRTAFDAYVARNRAGLNDPALLIPEPNDVMQSSYILLDERACFLDSSTGGKVPTQSILEVGVAAAAAQLLGGPGGGFNQAAFRERKGDFFVPGARLGVGSEPASAPPPTWSQARSTSAVASYTTSALRVAAGEGKTARSAPPAGVDEEVEVKFAVPPGLSHRLAQLGSHSPKVTTFTDTYYESAGFPLTTRDMWLRNRAGVFELKWPSLSGPAPGEGEEGKLRVDHYNESVEWGVIAAAVAQGTGLCLSPPFPSSPSPPGAADVWLASCGLSPFASLTTTRARHALTIAGHGVHVDVDSVAFHTLDRTGPVPVGVYEVGEVELVTRRDNVGAQEALGEVLSALGVTSGGSVRGKVLEYLKQHDVTHWNALAASGLLAQKLGPRQEDW